MFLAVREDNGASMQTSIGASLLDEQEFLAELAHLEQGMTAKRRTPAAPAMAEFAAFWDEASTAQAPAVIEDAAAVDARPHPLLGRAAAVAMFVFFMGVGAAGAAVVFHAQVARILAAW